MKNKIHLLSLFLCIGILQIVNAKIPSSLITVDSLKHYTSGDLRKLTTKHYYSNIDLAKVYAQEVLNRGSKNNNAEELADGYYLLGIISSLKGNHKNSLLFFDKGLEVSEKKQDQIRLLRFYLIEGNTHLYLDNYKQALFYYNKTIAIAKELKKTEYEIIGYLNIALIKKDIGQFKEALKIEKENIKRAEKVSSLSKRTSVRLFVNLSGTFLNLKENDSSIHYAKKGLLLSTTTKDLESSSYLYNLIGASYQSKKKDSIALEYFYKSLALVKTFKNNKRTSATYYLLAKSYASLKDQKKAIEYLHTAENLVAPIENFQSYELTETYKLLAEIYTSQNKRQLANEYFQKYIQSDSLNDLSKTEIIGDLYYKDLEKKQTQLQKFSRQKFIFKTTIHNWLITLPYYYCNTYYSYKKVKKR